MAEKAKKYVPKANFTRQMSYLATAEQRERVDHFVDEDTPLGAVLRELVDIGLDVKEGRIALAFIDTEAV